MQANEIERWQGIMQLLPGRVRDRRGTLFNDNIIIFNL
jgi:hypothetical protein